MVYSQTYSKPIPTKMVGIPLGFFISLNVLIAVLVFSATITPDLGAISHADTSPGFEGAEKRLEIRFSPHENFPKVEEGGTSISHPIADSRHRKVPDLRTIKYDLWVEVLKLVRCRVLSQMKRKHFDSYILSESSLFVYPHMIILKTCGTTRLLSGLTHLLAMIKENCGFPGVWKFFYSRPVYKFPEHQPYPHGLWETETKFLNNIFPSASSTSQAFSTTQDNWFSYLVSKKPHIWESSPQGASTDLLLRALNDDNELPDLWQQQRASNSAERHYTFEIAMTGLSPKASKRFQLDTHESTTEGTIPGKELATKLGIDAPSLMKNGFTDAYLFKPCGFSSNLFGGVDEERYATMHVTPESGYSFASYETNYDYSNSDEDLKELAAKIVGAFEPNNIVIAVTTSNAKEKTKEALVKVIEHLSKPESGGYDQIHWDHGELDEVTVVTIGRLEHENHPS